MNLWACVAMSKNRTSGGCISVPNTIIKHTKAIGSRVSSNSKKTIQFPQNFTKIEKILISSTQIDIDKLN